MATATTNERKGYLGFFAGESEPGKPYAYHVEANVSSEPEYFTASDDKKSRLKFNAALGRNPWLLLGAEVAKSATPENVPYCNTEKPFVSVTVFGVMADKLKDSLKKGGKIVMCGTPHENSYTNKNGEVVAGVNFVADSVYPLACRATAGGRPRQFVTFKEKSYADKATGELKSSKLATLVSGTVKSRGVVQTTQNGRKYLQFQLQLPIAAAELEARVNGAYNKDVDYGTSASLNCTVWGDQAERIGKVLAVGNVVVVTGDIRKREYNSKEYINFSLMTLSVMQWAEAEGAANAAPNNSAETAASAPAPTQAATSAPAAEEENGTFDYGSLVADDEDDDLPF